MDNTQWEVRVISSTEHIHNGSWGDIMFTLIRDSSAPVVIKSAMGDLARFASARPDGIGLITVIEENASFPPHESRNIMIQTLRQTKLIGSATVVVGYGFRAAAVRGMLNGLSKFLPHIRPFRVFRRIPDACLWFTTTVSQIRPEWNLTSKRLEFALEDFFNQF